MEEEGEDEDQDERRWRRKRMVISMRIDGGRVGVRLQLPCRAHKHTV